MQREMGSPKSNPKSPPPQPTTETGRAFVARIRDRLPVAAVIILVYFGLARSHPVYGVFAFAVIGALLLWTSPNRWGVGVALHYLSRRYWADGDDPVPPARPPQS